MQQPMTHFHSQTAIFFSYVAAFFFTRCSFFLHTLLLRLLTFSIFLLTFQFCLLTFQFLSSYVSAFVFLRFSFVLINHSIYLRCNISLSQFYKNARNKPSIYVTFNGYLPYIQPKNTPLTTSKSVFDILVGQGSLLLSIRFFYLLLSCL